MPRAESALLIGLFASACLILAFGFGLSVNSSSSLWAWLWACEALLLFGLGLRELARWAGETLMFRILAILTELLFAALLGLFGNWLGSGIGALIAGRSLPFPGFI
jgi:hypothetical protein